MALEDVCGEWRVGALVVRGKLTEALFEAAQLAYRTGESVKVIDVYGGPTFTVAAQ